MAKTKAAAKKKFPAKKTTGKKFAVKGKKPVKKPASKKPVVKTAPKAARPKRAAGMPELMRDAALKVLDDRQAEEIFTVDLAGKSSMADYLIIASGRASRQIMAMAQHLREAFEKLGVRQMKVEGMGDANWVLVDAGDVIIHLFRPEVRRYYNLESIWSNDGDDAQRSATLIK